jgi:hypothetical protein
VKPNLTQRSNVFADSWLQPRDILTPVATLVGFIVAAIGLSASNTALAGLLKPLAQALGAIIILFVGAAFLTCLSSLRNSLGLFKAGQFLFMVGWLFTGLFLFFFLWGYAYGIEVFSYPILNVQGLPRIDFQGLLSLLSLATYFLALFTFFSTRIERDKLLEETSNLRVDAKKTSKVVSAALRDESEDPRLALVGVAIKLETVVRSLAFDSGYKERTAPRFREMARFLYTQEVIDEQTEKSLENVWRIRNIIVHSVGDVTRQDARVALELASALLVKLSSVSLGKKR